MSNEIKIALLAVVAIALSIWGIKFIKGKNLLTRSNLYYVEYEDALSIQTSSSVVIQGVNVGFVADVKLQKGSEKVLVTLDLNKDLEVPKGTRAEIFANGFMGTKSVRLQFPPVEERQGMLEPGAYLIPGAVGFLAHGFGNGCARFCSPGKSVGGFRGLCRQPRAQRGGRGLCQRGRRGPGL